MVSLAPTVELNNGQRIPVVGLGTWKSQPLVVKQAVIDAVNAGYRHIDCAFIYGNENEVGDALKELFADGKIKREELFITSKLWNTFHSESRVKEGIQKSLTALGISYVDLYLMHWPVAYKEGGELMPKDAEGNIILSDVDYLVTWKAMEALVETGLCRSVGLSNFNKEQIQRILNEGTIKPAALEVECHPYLNQNDMLEFCKEKGITLIAYSPLGSPDRVWAKPDDPRVLEDPVIKQIAGKHGKSAAQICIRYQIQRGNVVIPKSATKSRIEENINVFDFQLTDDDMQAINSLNKNFRALVVEWMKKSKHYPF